MKVEARCLICQSPKREDVNRMLRYEYSNITAAKLLMSVDPAFADKNLDTVRRNVERHRKAHLQGRKWITNTPLESKEPFFEHVTMTLSELMEATR